MSGFRDALTHAGYLAAWRAVRAMPESAAERVFRYGADRAWRKNGGSIVRLRHNLRRVVGGEMPEDQLEHLVQAGVQSYARYWRETFRLPRWSPSQLLDQFFLEDKDELERLYGHGRGIILALPHAGNWDLAGAWACMNGLQLVSVAERLRPERLYQRFLDYRRSLGMEIVPLTGGDRPPIDVLAERLNQGGVVALLADRDLSTKGVEVDFFGAKTRMPPGPALLALRTGAPLLVANIWYEPHRTRARVSGPVAMPSSGSQRERVTTITQTLADSFAAGIAEHPQDWHMMQRVWLQDRGASSQPSHTEGPAGMGSA